MCLFIFLDGIEREPFIFVNEFFTAWLIIFKENDNQGNHEKRRQEMKDSEAGEGRE